MRINGLERVTEANFTHEMGHAVGYSQNSSGAPKGWDKATKSDKNAISGYGETGLRDDFADAWTAYREARETGPLAMEQFRAKYPNRAKLLDQVWANGTAA